MHTWAEVIRRNYTVIQYIVWEGGKIYMESDIIFYYAAIEKCYMMLRNAINLFEHARPVN